MEQLKRFRIPFETINDCTKNFDKENLIGKGGYGNVYKGILSWTDHKNQPVAVKRLDETGFQGNKEFYTEITMLSQYRHKNIIALVGFCDEGKEMIVVYEYASHGSLDKYLTDGKMLDQLSWKRRLKICIGIASALEYLHNHVAAQHRVIHRDMKSANILLDENWKPKLSDFGLSRIGLANQQNTFLITNVAGTHGYCDPQYERTGILTKESDVYSFGVVLFEVLCGRLVCVIEYHDQRRFLHYLVRTYYENGELDKIVDYRIRDHIKGTQMSGFSAIAYQCLHETREKRPTIHEVVLQLKKLRDTKAARETGALQEKLVQAAKNELEKHVELSWWRLQLEKRMRADSEEVKTLENAKLQFKETKDLLIKERETCMTEYPQTPEAKSISNGHFGNAEPQTSAARNLATEFDSKAKRPPIDRQHANVDALIECVMKDIGFSQGKPVAAFTIYKCLLHWKSFEAERTSVFDRLIQMIGSAIEDQDNNEHMAYWLSNAATLLFLLQRSIKSDGASSVRKPPTSLFGRMTMGFRSSPSTDKLAAAALEVVRQVEAKYPALLFKQQLTAYVEKMYGIISDNLKKELGPFLRICIQAPRATKGVLRSGRSFGKDSQSNHWQGIIDCLNTLLSTLKENFVPRIIVQKIFTQIFSYINVQLFNSLLLRRECCAFSNGEYVRAGLAELELWCAQAKEKYTGSAWDKLKHIRQAVGFLVIHQKYRISYDEIINDLCPILSVQQLYRICKLYYDDIYNTRSVSPDVISSMRVLMTEDSNNAASNSFLLDDSSSIPFSVDDLSSSLQVKDFADMKPAVELVENPAFQFLHD